MQPVKVKNLFFSYEGKSYVLEDVSFSVDKGDFVGVIGPNGAGKSTLFKLILGFLKPQNGEIELFGRELSSFKGWDMVGYVPQRLSVERSFPATVEELLRIVSPRERVRELIGFLHMDSFSRKRFHELSGGQQQLLLLGMAIASEPELLLLDEPTSGLDMHIREHILDILKDFSLNEGKTVMMISHDIGLVLRTVDKVMCLNRRLIYYGEPEHALDTIEELFGLREERIDGAS